MFLIKKPFKTLVLLSINLCVGVIALQLDNDTIAARAIFNNCSRQNLVMPCLAGKFSEIIDRSIDHDFELFDGFTLKRNSDLIRNNSGNGRSFSGFSSVRRSLYDFLDTHVLRLDVNEPRKTKDGGGGGGYGGFAKVGRKDRKYLYYAMMAVTGVFGLSVPIILKGLALVAGTALLASKAAFVMIGSIALKKIFQSDTTESKTPVKMHTHTISLDDHDRHADNGGYRYSTLNNNNNNNNNNYQV